MTKTAAARRILEAVQELLEREHASAKGRRREALWQTARRLDLAIAGLPRR
jgi:hypothetical protein